MRFLLIGLLVIVVIAFIVRSMKKK